VSRKVLDMAENNNTDNDPDPQDEANAILQGEQKILDAEVELEMEVIMKKQLQMPVTMMLNILSSTRA